MSDESPALDEAYERMARSGFEMPNGFVYHGPMACEALAALGCDDDIDDWARIYAQMAGTPVDPAAPRNFDWREALGSYGRLPEWIGFFERAIDEDGWPGAVALWVPRLLPSLAVALFHGVIRTAHAVRAIDAVDTGPRRAELARALAYWAARFATGQPAQECPEVDGVRSVLAGAAAAGARRYLARPTIVNLHGVTGAMAVELLVDHVPAEAAAGALAQVQAEHAALYRGAEPASEVPEAGDVHAEAIARSAASTLDAHAVKLVEACRRGFDATGDPAFAAAAETATMHAGPRQPAQ